MRNTEEQMKSALFRANMMEKYKYDPGPDWDQPDVFHYIIVLTMGYFMLKTWLSS